MHNLLFFLFRIWTVVWCCLTMPCSGTAAWTLRLTTWANAGQCCGGLKPLLGSVPLALVVGTLTGCPRVSYTFMCSLFPCLAALWETSKVVGLTFCHFWINTSTKTVFLLVTTKIICVFWITEGLGHRSSAYGVYQDNEIHIHFLKRPKNESSIKANKNKYKKAVISKF